MKDNRSLRNFLISPQRQVRAIIGMAVVGGIVYLTIIGFIINHLLSDLAYESQVSSLGPAVEEKIFLLIEHSIAPICLAGVVSILTLALAVLTITHRFYGPLVPIKRFVNEIKQGNYAARVSIRDTDEMHELVVELNEMAIALEKRHAT